MPLPNGPIGPGKNPLLQSPFTQGFEKTGTPLPVPNSFLLLEDGDNILLEDGGRILLED